MTYWLTGEEPWRCRRRLSHIMEDVDEQPPTPPPVVHRQSEASLDSEPPSEMDPVDSSPTMWLLANECDPPAANNKNPAVDMDSEDQHSVRSPSSCIPAGTKHLQSPRYRSAPLITSFHQQCESFPSLPLRTTSPQSCA